MEIKFIHKRKGSLELEFDDKTLPTVLSEALVKNEVDSYFYEPHPLIRGYRLYVEAPDALKELKSAITKVEKDWGEFSELLKKECTSSK